MNTKQKIKEQIAEAVESLAADIAGSFDQDENLKRAEAIKLLTEAHKNMNRF